MLKTINQYFIVLSIALYLLFFSKIEDADYFIYFTNLLSVLTSYALIFFVLHQSEKYYTVINLVSLVFFYSLFYVSLYNLISYIYRDNFYVFAESDPSFYDYEAIQFNQNSFFTGISKFLENESYSDLGMILLLSTLYKIVESNLILNFFYIIAGVITARSIFKICKNLDMSGRYSFLCSISYSLSSFILWFHSTGLKESFMVMIVVLFFEHLQKLKEKVTIRKIVVSILFISILLLFRPILSFFCILSAGFMFLLDRKITPTMIIIVLGSIISFVILFAGVFEQMSYLVAGGDVETFQEVKSAKGVLKGNIYFDYFVNILSSLLGPFPTFNPAHNNLPAVSFYSAGITFRLLLSVAFLMGLYYLIKLKIKKSYSILIFMLLEMFSLTLILESVNLRKSLPHFPIIYIVSFWFLDKLNNPSFFELRKQKKLKTIYYTSLAPLTILILYWNYR